MIPYVLVAGAWVLAMVYSIAKIDIVNRRTFGRILEDQREYLEVDDESVEDVEFREVDDFAETRKQLKKLGEKDEDIRFFTRQAIEDLDETKELQKNLQELKEVSFNPVTFKNIESTLEIIQRDIVQNGRDIITILVANKHGKHFNLEEADKRELKQELADNKRRLDKFRMLMKEGARFATQKDNESSDLDMDSWNKVFKQLNQTPPSFKGTT